MTKPWLRVSSSGDGHVLVQASGGNPTLHTKFSWDASVSGINVAPNPPKSFDLKKQCTTHTSSFRESGQFTDKPCEQEEIWVRFSSLTQSCPTPCNPMDCNMPGFSVHHQLLELTQTHVHRISDAIQPSHPLSSPSPSAFNLSQYQGLFQ